AGFRIGVPSIIAFPSFSQTARKGWGAGILGTAIVKQNELLEHRVGDGEVFVEGGDAEVELFFGDDERRRDDEVADPGLNRNAAGHHLRGDLVNDERLALDLVAHGVEELLGFAVLHDLDGKEEAEAADIADRWVLVLELEQLLANVGLELSGAGHKRETLHVFDGGEGGT